MQSKMEQQLKESKRKEMLKQKLETKKQQKIESEKEEFNREIQEPKYSDNELKQFFDDNNNVKINKKSKSTKYKK
jgi:hypothetical protein